MSYSHSFCFLLLVLLGCNSSAGQAGRHLYTNDLIQERSPYLLQHAHNPVHWQAWGEKALSRAKAENKLLLISIGYAACQLVTRNGCGWPLNALMVKAYVDAYRAFGKQAWLDAALKNGQLTLEKVMQPDHRLNRNYKDGKSVINGFLDDYALTAEAFTALYQVTFDEKWLYAARELTNYAVQHFFDKKTGFFFYTSDLDPPLVIRKTETDDNVIPSSNSLMAANLYVLGSYFYNTAWQEMAQYMLHSMEGPMTKSSQPDYYSNWGRLHLQFQSPPYEVAIVGNDFAIKRDSLLRHYLPNVLFLGGSKEGALELLKDKLQAGETMIYVCQGKVCKIPVRAVAAAMRQIGRHQF